jgi:hypothetical protein
VKDDVKRQTRSEDNIQRRKNIWDGSGDTLFQDPYVIWTEREYLPAVQIILIKSEVSKLLYIIPKLILINFIMQDHFGEVK